MAINTNINIIVIGGPTASGKTEISLNLSKHLDIEIISADSRQVFQYMDIGTAKPSKEEMQVVPHHIIDFLKPDEYFSAGQFGNLAYQKVEEISSRGKTPVIVGGSGFYIYALTDGLAEIEQGNNEKRTKLHKELSIILQEKGKEFLYEELKKVDIESAEKYLDKNPMRVIRALEFFKLNGIPFSEAQKTTQKRNIIPHYFAVENDRETLYNRINVRTELMWEQGLIKETESILNMGYSRELNSLNTVGYKECIAFLNNDISKERAIELMQQNTRRYAKRQITWFKKYTDTIYLDLKNNNYIKDILISNNI